MYSFVLTIVTKATSLWHLSVELGKNKDILDLAFNNVKPKDRYFVLE